MIINIFVLCIIVILSLSLGFNIMNNNKIIRSNRMSINMNANANADPLLLRAARGIIIIFLISNYIIIIANI